MNDHYSNARRFNISTMLRAVSLIGIFCAVVLVLYAPIVNAPFISDDWHWLHVAHERGSIVPDLFVNTAGERVGGSYNPLASLYVNSLYQSFGLNPTPFHVGSILIHVLTGCLVAMLVARWLCLYRQSAVVHEVEQGDSDENHSAQRRRLIAAAAALVFIVWPGSVETVAWISSIPHLLATLFYLLSVILFLRWKERGSLGAATLSLGAAAAAFVSKETAFSLPIVLVVIDVSYEWVRHRRFVVVRNSLRKTGTLAKRSVLFLGYFAVLGGALVARYGATGLTIGNYTDQQFIFRFKQILNTFGTFWEEFITAGFGRELWMSNFWSAPARWGLVVIAVAVVAAGVAATFILRRTPRAGASIAFIACCASIVPYLNLGFSRTSAESERYVYLPLVFFVLLLASLCTERVARSRRNTTIFAVCFAVILIIFVGETHRKVWYWHEAGVINDQIVRESTELIARHPEITTWYAVALPDTLNGAHVFRNNLSSALALRGALHHSAVQYIPVYLALTTTMAREDVMVWNSDEKGLLGETRNDAYIVTGVDREVLPFVTYELWGYDYKTFRSDTIRLNFTQDVMSALRAGSSGILTWDAGVLRRLPFPLATPA